MESLDLHPEELFDKADAGLANELELARLEAHLKACATCRVERQVRADFAAVGTSTVALELLVAKALHTVSETPETANLDQLVARAMETAEVPAPPRRRSLTPWLIAATLVSGLSFAAVAQFTGLLPRLLETRTETPPTAPEPVKTAPVPRANPVATVVADEPAVVDEVTPPPVVAAPPPRAKISKPAPELSPAPEPAVAAPDAATLFSLAHAARIAGRRGDAVVQLRELVARFPNEPAGALAWAELGTLWLEGGEPARAIDAFDTYLASSHGLLREEVLTSRAQAYGALGHAAEERAAWERLLQEFPNGLTSSRARARVEALDSTP